MEEIIWGVLGPEAVSSGRRTRTLGLGAATRLFNELAVPGLGGAWFGKQLFLALLGVAVAERARSLGRRNDNIQVTNAIEALGLLDAVARYTSCDAPTAKPSPMGSRSVRSIGMQLTWTFAGTAYQSLNRRD